MLLCKQNFCRKIPFSNFSELIFPLTVNLGCRQLRKRFLVIDNFVPTEERTRLLNLAYFDDNKDNWILNKEQYKLARPIAHNYRRPISDYAIQQSQNSPKYRVSSKIRIWIDFSKLIFHFLRFSKNLDSYSRTLCLGKQRNQFPDTLSQ